MPAVPPTRPPRPDPASGTEPDPEPRAPAPERCSGTCPADWWIVFLVSTAAVFAGVEFGRTYVRPGRHIQDAPDATYAGNFVRWDATYYRDITENGYTTRPGQSPVHFMPGYPLLVAAVWLLVGGPVEAAMVQTAHLCFLAALGLLGDYTQRRHGGRHPHARLGALVVAGFLPVGMFFHVGYTESLFLLICVGMLQLIDRGHHPLFVALVAAYGLLTRLVGPALLVPLLLYAWKYGRGGWPSVGHVALCAPTALIGVAALMEHHDRQFGDPIIFLRGRDDLWRVNPAIPFVDKVSRLVALEPVWGLLDSSSPAYWRHHVASFPDVALRLFVTNRVVFLAAIGLAAWGWHRRLLNRYELAMVACLIAIPYWVNGYDSNMSSMARYMSVCAPLYPVAGALVGRCRTELLVGFAAVGAALMAAHAALFSQGHWLM